MTDTVKRLYRSRDKRMFMGLCGGLGDFLGMDPTIIRLIFALSTIFTFPIPLIVYGVMMLVVPEEPLPASQEILEQ